MNSVKLNSIYKRYKNVVAVDNVSINIKKGEVFGIIGANGAGKTTLMEIMMGLRKADKGSVEILGYSMDKDKYKIKQKMGVLLQEAALYPKIKVKEAIELFSSYYESSIDTELLIKKMQIGPYLNRKFKKLSGGWKQRILLTIALVNDPDIVFLDEPTTGLDPEARKLVWDSISDFKSLGKTIVLTTHYMEEIDKYCDRVMILKKGKVVEIGSPSYLKKSVGIENASLEDVYLKYIANGEKYEK